jgi:pimeloyl-ACP methyl ester carboxylesterase
MPDTATSFPTDIYYRKTGAGPAVMLLHGFPSDGSLWDNVVGKIGEHFTVIVPDLPGSGKSPLDKATGISDMAVQIKRIMDHEGVDKAVVAGHSMGGYVALAFAALYPERLAGLSLVHSTTVADDDEKKKNRQKAIELIRKGGKKAFTQQMVPNLFSDSFKQHQPAVVEEHIKKGMTVPDEGMINFYEAMMARPDRSALLQNATYPIMWVMGSDDKIIYYKKILEFAHQSYINFVYLYKDCGHMSMIESPERLTDDIREFCTYSYFKHRR